jgi:phage shock protein A
MRRLSMIFRSKASRALDQAEDPRETLDYSYERQLDQLQQMRRGLADVATARKRVQLQAQEIAGKGTKLEDQARRALEQGREDLAREALTRRETVTGQLSDLQVQYQQLQEQEQRPRSRRSAPARRR